MLFSNLPQIKTTTKTCTCSKTKLNESVFKIGPIALVQSNVKPLSKHYAFLNNRSIFLPLG